MPSRIFLAEGVEGLEGVAGADEEHGAGLEALVAGGPQEQVRVGDVAGLDPDVRIGVLRAQDRGTEVDGAEVVRADADDLGARFLENSLLVLGDRGAVDRILVLDPDLEVLRLLAEGLGDEVQRRVGGLPRERPRPGPGADVVRKPARRQLGRQRVRIPIELLVRQRRFARGARHGTDVAADEGVDLVAVRELLDRGDALLRAARVAAYDDDLAAHDAAGGVRLFGRKLVAAVELVAVERERARERVHRPRS